MKVVCLGLSHRTASVEIREKFAISEPELGSAFAQLSSLPGIAESVIVSTCNRVEIYAAAEDSSTAFASLRNFAAGRTQNTPAPCQQEPFYALDGSHSINHLFRVVCGLDSMILGETEILGQIGRAHV